MVAFIIGESLRNMFVIQSEIYGSCNVLLYEEDHMVSLRVFPQAISKGAWYRQGFKTEDAIWNWLSANGWDIETRSKVSKYFEINKWRRFWIENRECKPFELTGGYIHTVKLVWAIEKRRFTYTFEHPTRGFYDVLNTRFESCHISLNHAAHVRNVNEEKAKRTVRQAEVQKNLTVHMPGC
jgi:hypothetical protein